MLKCMRPGRPSPALIVSLMALVLAMGGFAIAAIPDSNGVLHGCYKKKKGTLRLVSSSRKCKKSERAISWNQKGQSGSTGARGSNGSKGDKGDTGAPGEAVAHANVLGDGTLDSEEVKSISAGNVTHPSTGIYCFGGLSFDPKSVIVSGDNAFGVNDTLAAVRRVSTGSTLTGCAVTDIVRVTTVVSSTGALADRRFYIWFED